jgi:hypothetical protein
METKENLLYLFWNCSLVKQFWFAVGNLLMMCGIVLPLTAREITLGISESYTENQNTVNNILLILKCYIYRCRCKGGNYTFRRRSSIPKILYQNREKFHFLHVPKTDRAN